LDIVPVRAGTVAEGYPTAGLTREPDAILAAAALGGGPRAGSSRRSSVPAS